MPQFRAIIATTACYTIALFIIFLLLGHGPAPKWVDVCGQSPHGIRACSDLDRRHTYVDDGTPSSMPVWWKR